MLPRRRSSEGREVGGELVGGGEERGVGGVHREHHLAGKCAVHPLLQGGRNRSVLERLDVDTGELTEVLLGDGDGRHGRSDGVGNEELAGAINILFGTVTVEDLP